MSALLLLSYTLPAQVAHFAGVETVVASSNLASPQQVAVDAAGDVFVLDVGNSRVVKEAPSPSGYQQSIVTQTAMSSPAALAVDPNGNIFIVDTGNNRILKETPSGGSYTEAIMGISGLNAPGGIAVDASGNLYISDTGNSRIVEEVLSGSNYSQSTLVSSLATGAIAVDPFGQVYVQIINTRQVQRLTISGSTYTALTLMSNLSASVAISVDSVGNVYINDGANSRIFRELPSGNISYVFKNVIAHGTTQLSGLAVDGNRNLYFSDPHGNRVLKLAQSGGDFGTVAVGSTSSPLSLLFSFDGGGTIGSSSVVTQGITGLDYSDSGTGSCTTNGSAYLYASGDTCTLDVSFSPKGPGGRYGAAVIYSATGNLIATGYVQGNGSGPKVRFPGVVTTFTLPGLSSPTRIKADAAGNLYIVNAVSAFNAGNAIYKETWTGSGYIQSTIASATDLVYPLNLVLDGAGNVFVLDEGVYGIYKFAPNPGGGYTKTTFDTANSNSNALGVDGFGNIYFASGYVTNNSSLQIDTAADGYYGHRLINIQAYSEDIAVDYQGDIYLSTALDFQPVLKETPVNGSYLQSTVLSDLSPFWIATDGVGNLYVASSGIYEETPTGSSYARTLLTNVINGAGGVAVDGSANVYFTSNSQGTVGKIDFSQPAALHFASTSVGSTSSDSPQSTTLQNVGNTALSFPIPGSGTNPLLPSGFTMRDTLPTDCPLVGSGSSGPGSLAVEASCNFAVSYSPGSAADLSNWMTITDDALNAAAPSYATQSIALVVSGHPLNPTVQWSNPAHIVYGTALSPLQLSATANVAGTFSYSPAAGTVLGAGSHTLSVTFTPADSAAFNAVTTTVTIVVDKAMPAITWPAPSGITYGTPLTSTQLNASTPVPGTFSYSPIAGTVLNAGTQTLSVTFTPTDTTNYTTAATNVTLTVAQATPTLSWSAPAAINYGTALDSTQLNATASVPGTLTYTPASGTVLSAGYQTLSVTFVPTDSTNYTTVTKSVLLLVNQIKSVVTWLPPAPIVYGTRLSSAQLNATASVPGTLNYQYPGTLGALLRAGTYTLTVNFYPQDYVNYSTATASVTLTVNKATSTLTWPAPAAITYGTPLSTAQLNATANTPGSFVYSPAAGTVLSAGSQTLNVTFTPTDATDYSGSTASVTLTVNKAAPVLTWPAPAAITYGTPLSAAQLNATANTPGSFVYSPAAGTVLSAGSQTLNVTFAPTDASNFSTGTANVSLTVNRATPTITWPTPPAILLGTPLSATQLNATASVPGAFVYNPPAGTILPLGASTLSATFTPTDAIDYATATANVTISVGAPIPAISNLSPTISSAGSSGFTLTINGAGFVAGSTAYWGNTALSTQYVSGVQLTAQVPATAIAAAGTAAVTVQTPAPGGGTSNTLTFEIDTAGSTTPPAFNPGSSTVTAGSTVSYSVTLPSGATNISVVCLNLPANATCSYSAVSNTLTITTAASTPQGTYLITAVFTETLPGVAAALVLLPLLLVPPGTTKRRKLTRLLVIVLVGIAIAVSTGISGCGGSSGNGSTTPTPTHQATSSATLTLVVH